MAVLSGSETNVKCKINDSHLYDCRRVGCRRDEFNSLT